MIREFPKAYEPKIAEDKWYDIWHNNKLFAPSMDKSKPAYSILMPPPNVTGILHFGHVLNITLQDLYIRWKKLTGYDVCWFPGTDHAGIATQTRVESDLKKQGLTRYDVGREKFIEKVWEWREKYGGHIIKQLKLLGVGADWDRLLFTMDKSASNAVQEVFIKLFDDGLIYKGKRIINWSPLAQTALSDEEVDFKEVQDQLYTFRYYFEDNVNYLQVATVRPETIFGDVAVAVNPKDERYNKYLGQKVRVPLVNRLVPIIADDYADPTFGTGCVKITPAHDPNDFEVGMRHNLERINTINPDATLNENAGEYNGIDRFEARKLILNKLKELDLIEKIEDYTHNVGFSQRGGEPVEPYLSDQWFVSMKPLAEDALKVVLEGKVRFYPNHWTKTYEHWMLNIRDWCISRQLWWGHRIPVYYTPDGKFTAAKSEDEARKKLNLSSDIPLRQDEDVLDTWFSSWLWPLTTMRWKHDGTADTTEDLNRFLPTDLLVTAPDIIFFWVARMIMATEKFKQEIPFKDVYFTSMIRDGLGRKLSKSLGNSPDPIDIIDKYGSDAVRFTMIYLAPLGQDVKMDVDLEHQDISSMEIGRNFANKVWNAGRFLLMNCDNLLSNEEDTIDSFRNLQESEWTLADKWIYSRFQSTIKNIHFALDNFKVNDYSRILYDFVWRDFCDWYVEIMKVQIKNSSDMSYKQALIKFAINIYDSILILLHPVMPFITEEIYHLIHNVTEEESIVSLSVPAVDESKLLLDLEDNFLFFQSLIETVRSVRASSQVPNNKKVPIVVSCSDANRLAFINELSQVIEVLGKCSEVTIARNAVKPENSIATVVRDVEIFVILKDAVDLDKEKERLAKEITRLEGNVISIEKKLSNEKFVANAPDNIVQYEREKLQSMKDSLEKVKANFESL